MMLKDTMGNEIKAYTYRTALETTSINSLTYLLAITISSSFFSNASSKKICAVK